MSLFAPINAFNSLAVSRVLAPIALTATAFLTGGCLECDEETWIGGRPPQDPVVPAPEDLDPCYGLTGDALAECLGEESLKPRYGIDFEATDYSFNGAEVSDWAGSKYVIERGSAFIPCDLVLDYMQHLVSDSTVCFRGLGKWVNRPPAEFFPPEELPEYMIANAQIALRETGASLSETRYATMYNGYNEYGYPIKETEDNPQVINISSPELPSYDGDIGFIHAVTGIYDQAQGLLHINWANTVAGDQPPDLENPSELSVITLYSELGHPTFLEDEENNPTGIIGNEGLYFMTAEGSVMTFHIGSGFSSEIVSLPWAGEDLDGNTASSLSATLYTLGD